MDAVLGNSHSEKDLKLQKIDFAPASNPTTVAFGFFALVSSFTQRFFGRVKLETRAEKILILSQATNPACPVKYIC